MECNEPTPEVLQRKLYFLLEQLQEMARELPPSVKAVFCKPATSEFKLLNFLYFIVGNTK